PGVKFPSYAAIRVRGAIVDHLRSVSNICRTTLRQIRKIEDATRDLEQKLHRQPTDPELAAALQVPVADIAAHRAEMTAGQPASLDEIYADHLLAFRDQSDSAEERLVQRDLRKLLARAVADLPQREQLVLQLYYVEELNVYEVAEVMGVTTGRVSQIKKAAVGRLRDSMARLQDASA
ncbi:MAG: sigma-70 family RNA polymerase sigma factor, partial [Gemmobacter sp.]|nr:sigma-70 family RNA polymerase sigma factor [Gemmobacter sp.]